MLFCVVSDLGLHFRLYSIKKKKMQGWCMKEYSTPKLVFGACITWHINDKT